MNFTQMHERLRLEFQRRIQRGTSSISLVSRKTGFGMSHLSNFLHSRTQLSLEGLDRVLASLDLSIEELIDASARPPHAGDTGNETRVPLVSHSTALFEPLIRPAAVQLSLQLPYSLNSLGTRAVASRRPWERFVAIRIDNSDVNPMSPVLFPDAIAVIDRHYNTLRYTEGKPVLYAIRKDAHLVIRYADFLAMHLVLRPRNLEYPVDLIEIGPDTSPREFIAGRVALILNLP